MRQIGRNMLQKLFLGYHNQFYPLYAFTVGCVILYGIGNFVPNIIKRMTSGGGIHKRWKPIMC